MARATEATPAGGTILRAEGISKRFGTTRALDGVSVSFRAGEVHALMGENGAGKSTLGKVIAGLHKQDAGTVAIVDAAGRERVLRPGSIEDAFDAGVRIVHQELAQCPNLSVAENLGLHALPTRHGMVDRRRLIARAEALVHRFDPGIDVRRALGELSPGRRQIVQIASSLDERAPGPVTGSDSGGGGASGGRARVIVFDEPTSSLSIAEADRLLEITRGLARHGITIIYVSHRMGEIFAVCDRVTVLRDGRFIGTSVVKDIDEPTLVEQMIGRRLGTPARGRAGRAGQAGGDGAEAGAIESRGLRDLANDGEGHAAPGAVRLRVLGVSSPGRLVGASLEVRAGEVVGVGGLVGCGRSELLDAIFGLDPKATGTIEVDGRRVSSVRAAIDAGVGYVPEDRRLQGLFFLLGIDENITMPFMAGLAAWLGVRRRGREGAVVREKTREFQVKAASVLDSPATLSGGNQQKLLLARWMGGATKVLLLDEPTRGIDVGTKAEIYKLVRHAADRGAAVLLVSSEMPELLAMSDRVLVMCQGRIGGELAGEAMTQANILRLATREALAS